MKKLAQWLLVSVAIFVYGEMFAAAETPKPLTVEEFVNKMVDVHHYDRKQLVQLFQQTAFIPEVIDRINRPFEQKPWDFYRTFFVTPDRIQGGVAYWHAHEQTLAKVSQEFGVSPAVIVAIIGIESQYGHEKGKYPELGALATLSFHYPKRAVFFQNELEQYLLLTQEYHLSPLSLSGSYAGALGLPQFMPSNYRQCAISYDGNPTVNLLENNDDAIASIARYLQRAGWKAHQPVAFPAQINGPVRRWLLSADAKPIYRIKTFEKFGVTSLQEQPPLRKAALIEMRNTHTQEYWLTFENFYAIMAYNPRTTYAMAIYQLSQEIEKAYHNGQQPVEASAATPT